MHISRFRAFASARRDRQTADAALSREGAHRSQREMNGSRVTDCTRPSLDTAFNVTFRHAALEVCGACLLLLEEEEDSPH
jgi:hypothetical protein